MYRNQNIENGKCVCVCCLLACLSAWYSEVKETETETFVQYCNIRRSWFVVHHHISTIIIALTIPAAATSVTLSFKV